MLASGRNRDFSPSGLADSAHSGQSGAVADARVLDRARAFLGPDEVVNSAFEVSHGVRPGVEAFVPLAAPFVPFRGSLLITAVTAGLVCGVAVMGVAAWRRRFLIAVGSDSVKLLRYRRLSKRLIRCDATYPLEGAIGRVTGRGDSRVAVGGTSYWVGGQSADEARRLIGQRFPP